MIRPGSQNDRVLQVLADGEWHTSRELHERAGYMRTNSRVSELRTHGHRILGESVPGETGTDGYRYRLVAPLSERPGAGIGRDSVATRDDRTKPKTAGTRSESGEQLALEVAA